MKFDLSEDQSLLQSSTRDFFAKEFPLEKTRRVMEHEARGFETPAWRQLAEMGYPGLLVPEAAGGQGLGPIELAIVCDEAGRVCLPGPLFDVQLAAATLAAAGGQDALVRAVAAGQKIVTIAWRNSPYAGEARHTTHFANGRVKGRKYFVPFAASADALLVTAAEGLVLVDGPFEVVPLQTIDLAQRFGEVTLDHPATLLGPTTLLERTDQLAAVGAAATLLGVMVKSLELTLGYLQTREAFKRQIGSFQALQHRMADMLLRTESSRSAVYRAAWCLQASDPDTALACATAKAYAGDAARLVTAEAIQMHGGIGFTWELDVHFYFKRAKTYEMHYGSTEAQLERVLQAVGY
jgi:alkylation response protein AidB-like acyl-CoA dehydrogenase